MQDDTTENDRIITEKMLRLLLERACRRLHMGLADWFIDQNLRRAIRSHPNFSQVFDVMRRYDETLKIASDRGVSFDRKFVALAGLVNR